MLSFNRKIQFSSAYRLSDPLLSGAENVKRFGADHWKNVGGSFEIEAQFIREGSPAIDPLTGMIVNLPDVDGWLSEVREFLTSQTLNTATEPQVPTLEVLLQLIAAKLEERITRDHDELCATSGANSAARYAHRGHIVRLHKLKLSKRGAPGSVVTMESVSLYL